MTPMLAQRPRADRTLERLYRRHVGDVYRYAFAVLHNSADAEDVTQTTFMNAYRALERGERPHTPHNWLIAIAHNVCRQRFRQSARRPNEVAWDDDIADQLIEEDESPTGEDIGRALSYLAFNQRAALVMRELEGRSYAEIADVLDLSVSAVETLIFRARRALREQLEGSLTCGQAELAISKQLDGRLSRSEKGALRAHLRECPECARFARSQRAQRAALKSLGAVPVPASLISLFGGGGTTAGVAIAAKAAAVVAAAAVAGGTGYESVHHVMHHPASQAKPTSTSRVPATTARAASPVRPAQAASPVGSAHGEATPAGKRHHHALEAVKARGHGRGKLDKRTHGAKAARPEEKSQRGHGRGGPKPKLHGRNAVPLPTLSSASESAVPQPTAHGRGGAGGPKPKLHGRNAVPLPTLSSASEKPVPGGRSGGNGGRGNGKSK